MKKHITLSLMAVGLLGSANLQAADDLSTMFSEGKASGQIRAFSISRSMDYSKVGVEDFTRTANAIGGYLKYETADFKGLNFGAAFYTTNGFANRSDRTSKKFDPTLLGKDNESYSILGEAYIAYNAKELGSQTNIKLGRQKLDTPMAGSDDARMLPNLFEAVVVSNTDIPDTTLIAAHVTRFAQGTFGRAYGAGGILSGTSGYSVVDPSNQVGDFENMGSYAVGKKTDGVSVLAATYTGVKGLKLQLWDYYAHDILNVVYGEVDFSWKCLLSDSVKPFVAAQFIKENDVGDKELKAVGGNGKIDSLYWGAKVGASIENFTAYVAYSQTSKNSASDAAYANAIASPWGGMPAYTQGMVTRHQFLAGTKATKLAVSYNFKDIGLKTIAYYANFDMDKHNGYTYGDADEYGFDFIYNTPFVKNLQLRLRANYARDFNVNATGDTTSWDEYRFIANYTF
ncbi:MAG: OprD family porin [Sulfurimonas sp.]|uniref:OprD family outer membrane porin n=1 Tax=Sulfurimonas sp. TaxID=2022749 RepID=UPI0025F36BFF|nr:OprD family outer membrane porin [Sulfurimonas sp.]MCK9490764.1 OprD family porin [Sulfurimonas sp.]